MNEAKNYALLDADFISKLYDTAINSSDRLINRILTIDKFDFVCHQQTIDELSCRSQMISSEIQAHKNITVYTDQSLIEIMLEDFGQAAYILYFGSLQKSCNIFSQNFFSNYYAELDNYVRNNYCKCNLDELIEVIKVCEASIGSDNNLGEIKIYTMAQILERVGVEKLYSFCSDDRTARYKLSEQTNIECISALAAFYLAKKYLKMLQSEAQLFFDSWLEYHQKFNQYQFQIYNQNGDQREKLPGQTIFNMLYNDELILMKNGFFRRK